MKKIKKNLKVIGTGLLFLNLTSCMNLFNKPDIIIEDYLVQKNSYYVLVESINEQWEIKEISIQPRARDNSNQEVLQITSQFKQISPFFEVVEKKARYHCQSLTKYQGYHPCSSSKLSMMEESNSGHVIQSYVSDITMNVLRFGTAPGYQPFSKDKSVSYINRNYSVVINEEAVQDILNETNLIKIIQDNRTLIAVKKTVLAVDFGSMPNSDDKPKNYANNTAPEIKIGEFDNDSTSAVTRFKVTTINQGGGIGKINIYLDNTRLNPKIRGTQTNGDGSITKEYELDLPYGVSVIKAEVYDYSNKNKSKPVSHKLIKDYYSQPTLHVLSIGIKDFEDSRLNLKYTVNDARLFGKAIEEQSQGLFKEVNVH
ncbi:MAG: hypothetical protein Q9M50_11225 [Methylococcales bacterium]|nr:hypothetical protein [Methylococcales bacterium]